MVIIWLMMVNIYIYMYMYSNIYICICTVIYIYTPGWWYTHPSEQYESQLGWWHSQYVETEKMIKHVPNHQPEYPIIISYPTLSRFVSILPAFWLVKSVKHPPIDSKCQSWYHAKICPMYQGGSAARAKPLHSFAEWVFHASNLARAEKSDVWQWFGLHVAAGIVPGCGSKTVKGVGENDGNIYIYAYNLTFYNTHTYIYTYI